MSDEELVPTSYDFLLEEKNEGVDDHLQQVEEWIAAVQSVREKQTTILQVENSSVEPNITSLPDFLTSLSGENEKITTKKEEFFQLEKDVRDSTSLAEIQENVANYLVVEAELLQLQLQLDANKAEAKRLIAEEEKQLYTTLAQQLVTNSKRLLKGSSLKWLVHEGKLVQPYDKNPQQLSDHIYEFRQILATYEDEYSVASRFRRLSKKNNELFAALKHTVAEIVANTDRQHNLRDQSWRGSGLSSGWTERSFQGILDQYLYIIYRETQRLQEQDTEGERVVELHDQVQDRFRGIGGEIFDIENEQKKEMIRKITSHDVTEKVAEAYDTFVYLGNETDPHKTAREIVRLVGDKIIALWRSKYGEVYQSYQDHMDAIMAERGRQPIELYSGLHGLLRLQDAQKPIDSEKISLSFIAYFRNSYPTEAALISEELQALENQSISALHRKIIDQYELPEIDGVRYVTSKEKDFTGMDGYEFRKLMGEIVSQPSRAHYFVLMRSLQKLRVNGEYEESMKVPYLLAALAACQAEISKDDLPKSAYSVWHSVITLQRRPEELVFLDESRTDYSSRRVLDERARFFSSIESRSQFGFNGLDINKLLLSAEDRFDAYRGLLASVTVDTLVVEALLRHEFGQEDVSAASVQFLIAKMKKCVDTQKRLNIKGVFPDLTDIFENHEDLLPEDLQLFEGFKEKNPSCYRELTFSVFLSLVDTNDFSEQRAILQAYLETASTSTEVIRWVEAFGPHVNPADLFSILDGVTKAIADGDISKWVLATQKQNGIESEEIHIPMATSELKQVYRSIDPTAEIVLHSENWKTILYTYIQAEADMGYLAEPEAAYVQKVRELFEQEETKTFCFDQLQQEWQEYLAAGDVDAFPLELSEVSEFVEHHMGAGPLKYVTAVCTFCRTYKESMLQASTAGKTSAELLTGMAQLEERFTAEKWSQKERADVYLIASDILESAPSLFADFLAVFTALSKSHMRVFVKQALPLYQARIAILNVSGESNREVANKIPRDLVAMRRELRGLLKVSDETSRESILRSLQEQSLMDIRARFQAAFGIISVPEEFTQQHIRSIQNNARYLANINGSDQKKEAKLALFLALKLNGSWDSFRNFEAVNLDSFFSSDSPQYRILVEYLAERKTSMDPIAQVLGISEDELKLFWAEINRDTSNLSLMNVQTVDSKLSMILRSLDGLSDPDSYEQPLEKLMVDVYAAYGVSTVNRTLAQSFQQENGRELTFKTKEQEDEFLVVQQALKDAFAAATLEWGTEAITAAQSELKPISGVYKTLEIVEMQEIPKAIDALQAVLLPSSEVVEAFKSMGEDFSTESGAIAVGKDIDYLENIFAKHEATMSEPQKKVVVDYLTAIRKQLSVLQDNYQLIQQRFSQLAGSMHGSGILQTRLAEIQAVISQSSDEKEYVSVCTNDINLVIENIRACLGCLQKEVNNDTNLAFGDPNKFFVMTRSSHSEGSMSDQLVLVEPVRHVDGTQEVSFVMDRLYGIRSADVFLNHITVLWQKYQQVKKQFPDMNLSVLITQAALSTSGVSAEYLQSNLEQIIGKHSFTQSENSVVNIVASAGSDHYIEFGTGSARESGERNVSGVVLRLE